jgi:6-phosphogluconolactonase (cycloisomerase 2 family)
VHAGRGKLTANERAAISPEAGHGPRHMAFSPDNKCLYLYVLNELSGQSRNMQSILARER